MSDGSDSRREILPFCDIFGLPGVYQCVGMIIGEHRGTWDVSVHLRAIDIENMTCTL
jgi:hypothetical protein